MTPNAFAYLVLLSYPIVVIILFRRLPVPKALIWSILAGYLFLPEGTEVDLPLLPAINKTLIPSLMAGLMCWMISRALLTSASAPPDPAASWPCFGRCCRKRREDPPTHNRSARTENGSRTTANPRRSSALLSGQCPRRPPPTRAGGRPGLCYQCLRRSRANAYPFPSA